MPNILHVLETCIYGPDLAAMERFYGRTLGLEKISSEHPRHVFFRVSNQSVLLIFNPDETRREQEVPSHGTTGAGHVAFAVAADTLDAWRDTLANHGVAIEHEMEWPNAARSLYFRDPAGNSVELVTQQIWGPEP